MKVSELPVPSDVGKTCLSLDAAQVSACASRRRSVNVLSHTSLSETELRDYIERNVKEYKSTIEFLEQVGMPVLRINMAAPIWGNIRNILEFIHCFSGENFKQKIK